MSEEIYGGLSLVLVSASHMGVHSPIASFGVGWDVWYAVLAPRDIAVSIRREKVK